MLRLRSFVSRAGVCLACLLASVEAQAQSAVELEPIVITANRGPQSALAVGSAVTVISRKQIEAARAENVLQVLETVSGVIVNQAGGVGGAAEVSIRGAAGDQTLVLLDGIRLNDPSSTGSEFDFSVFSLANVERIEVLRGPQSGLYGSDAIGGVINIITRKGSAEPEAKAEIEGGSYSTFAQRGFVSGSENGISVAAAASNFRTSGFSRSSRGTEDDPAEKRSANVRLDLDPSTDFGVTVALGRYELDAELDATTRDTTDTVDRTLSTASATARLSLLNGAFNNQLTAFTAETERVFFDDDGDSRRVNGATQRAIQTSFFDGVSKGFEYQGDLTVRDVDRLSFGGKIDLQSGKSLVDGALNGVRQSYDESEVWRSAFALYNFNPTDALTITAAGRVDEFGPVAPEETYRFTAAYRLNDFGTKLRASYGTGAKAPTIQQRFGLVGLAAGNPDLKVETSAGYDIGVDQTIADGIASFSATYFHNDVENLIEFEQGPDGIFRSFNVDAAELEGFELSGELHPASWLSFSASYTYLRAVDAETGLDLRRRAEHSATFRATMSPTDRLRLTATALYTGERFNSSGERDLLDDYIRVDLSGSYTLSAQAEAFFRVENLLDEDYEEILNFGTAERSGYAGLRVKF